MRLIVAGCRCASAGGAGSVKAIAATLPTGGSFVPVSLELTAYLRDLRRSRPAHMLVVAHRGVSAGVIPENTVASAELALRSGADIVEVDATVTRDGVALAHHDGTEPENLGISNNLATLTAAQAAAHPHLAARVGGRPVPVPPLREVVDAVLGCDGAVHIDRAWHWWPAVLRVLDGCPTPERIVLKAPARPELWRAVAEHPVPYPAIAIVRSLAEVDDMLALPGIAWAGMEFIARSRGDELAAASSFGRVHDLGLPILVNSENLDAGPDLFCGYDDHAAVRDGGATWGRLLALGADDIQTDVPWLLDRYRREHPDRRATGT